MNAMLDAYIIDRIQHGRERERERREPRPVLRIPAPRPQPQEKSSDSGGARGVEVIDFEIKWPG